MPGNEKFKSMMKNKKLVLTLFLLTVAAGVWHPLSQIIKFGFPERHQAVFRFGAVIDDPDEPFSGRGVLLRIEDQTLSADKYYQIYNGSEYDYAVIEGDGRRLAKVVDIARKPETGKQVIRMHQARHDDSRAEKIEGRPAAFHYKVSFQPKRFTIEKKPTPEAKRAFSEAVRSGRKCVITVRVYANGYYAITDLEIDGMPIHEFFERVDAGVRARAAEEQKI